MGSYYHVKNSHKWEESLQICIQTGQVCEERVWLTDREKVPGEKDVNLALLLWLGGRGLGVGSLAGEGTLLPASSGPPPSLCLGPATPLC